MAEIVILGAGIGGLPMAFEMYDKGGQQAPSRLSGCKQLYLVLQVDKPNGR